MPTTATEGQSTSANAQQGKSKSGGNDQQFVTEAGRGGLAEVKLGQLAQEKAQSDAVKQFAKQMVQDHTQANDQLKNVAQQIGANVPDSVGPKEQAEYDRLSKLSGDEFDKAYMRLMVSDHKKDVNAFQKEANKGKNDQVKQFAQTTLPTLKTHLQLAQDAAGKVGQNSADRTKTDADRANTHDKANPDNK